MSPEMSYWLLIGVIVALIIGFFVTLRIIARQRANRILINIWLNNSDIMQHWMDKRKTAFVISGRRYLNVKDAVRKRIFRTQIVPVLNYDIETAMPFIMQNVEGKQTKIFLGSEQADRYYEQKIWDRIGGLGNSPIDMKMIMIIAVVAIIGFVIYQAYSKKDAAGAAKTAGILIPLWRFKWQTTN